MNVVTARVQTLGTRTGVPNVGT